MIGRLSGKLVVKSPPMVVIDCHGVGYEVLVSMNTYYPLPALGEATTLLTQLIVREDAHILYGFGSAPEREAFRQLTRISGLGPKTALSILSGMTVDDLANAVGQQDAALLVRIPGIGKKTAERMLLELKDKIGSGDTVAAHPTAPGARTDILQALLALGYSDKEAQQSLKQLPSDINVSEGIKLALKSLAR